MKNNLGERNKNLLRTLRGEESIHLHWLDNFQRYELTNIRILLRVLRCLARNALFLNRELFKSLAWTAHGVKVWDRVGTLEYVLEGGLSVPAMPELEEVLSEKELSKLVDRLSGIEIWQYDSSITKNRDVRRVPLKVSGGTPVEVEHQLKSYDGLGTFHPYDIYSSNIASRDGLLEALERVQQIDGFGAPNSPRGSKYSILLVDVAIYWQLFRIFYTFTGLAPIRHDLFLFLGLWHTYQHCHKLIWGEFRSTFLADAFFELFPTESLLFKPKLLQSSTFFSYIRLSYSSWRGALYSAISRAKKLMLEEQMEFMSGFPKCKESTLFFR